MNSGYYLEYDYVSKKPKKPVIQHATPQHFICLTDILSFLDDNRQCLILAGDYREIRHVKIYKVEELV